MCDSSSSSTPSVLGWAGGRWPNACNGIGITPSDGLAYVADRVAAKTAKTAYRTRKRVGRTGGIRPVSLQAGCGRGRGAQSGGSICATALPGDVLLFQSDPDLGSISGIPLRQHAFNGWTDVIHGRLRRVHVHAGHLDIVEGAAGDCVASEVRRALRSQGQAEERLVDGADG